MKNDDQNDIQWTKDNGEKPEPFNFDDFLNDGPKPTETQRKGTPAPVKTAQGGDFRKEETEPFAEFEAREKTMDEPTPSAANQPTQRPTLPKAEPRPHIYVTPPDVGYEPPKSHNGGGSGGETGKWILAAVAVVVAVVLLFVILGGNKSDGDAEASPSPTASVSPTPTAMPTDTPQTQAPQVTVVPVTATVTVTAGKGGTVSPNGTATANEGESLTFTITPDSGYTLNQLIIDGVSVQPTLSYTFTKLSGSHTLYAVFELVPQQTPTPTAEPTPVPTPEPTQTPTEPPQPDEPVAPASGSET